MSRCWAALPPNSPVIKGAHKVATKSRHPIHMTSEVTLEVDVGVLPAEPRCSYGELFSSQLSVLDTMQACEKTRRKHLLTWISDLNQLKDFLFLIRLTFFSTPTNYCHLLIIRSYSIFSPLTHSFTHKLKKQLLA